MGGRGKCCEKKTKEIDRKCGMSGTLSANKHKSSKNGWNRQPWMGRISTSGSPILRVGAGVCKRRGGGERRGREDRFAS